jgi:hypothetical protein
VVFVNIDPLHLGIGCILVHGRQSTPKHKNFEINQEDNCRRSAILLHFAALENGYCEPKRYPSGWGRQRPVNQTAVATIAAIILQSNPPVTVLYAVKSNDKGALKQIQCPGPKHY